MGRPGGVRRRAAQLRVAAAVRTRLGTSALLCACWFAVDLAAPWAPLAAEPIFSIADPRGDDHGDGVLRYPRSHHFSVGDLDLVSFSARPEKDGTLFEAIFARPIRKPGPEAIDAGGTTLDKVARIGFYTLNVDVYIDRDRIRGSGRVAMLPGRRAEIDSSTAWERVVVVTPQPYDCYEDLGRLNLRAARDSLERTSPRVDDEALERLSRDVKSEIDSTVYFATRMRVIGPKLQFFVPGEFLGGPARGSWAYVVAVSAADLVQRFDLRASFLTGSDFSQGLAILPVAPGLPADRLGGGRENDDLQAPLMDVLIAPGTTQESALGDYDRHAWRPARLRGIVPAEVAR
jgi:hypothetical protein